MPSEGTKGNLGEKCGRVNITEEEEGEKKIERSVDGVRSSPRFCGRPIYETNTHEQMEQPSTFSFFFSFLFFCGVLRDGFEDHAQKTMQRLVLPTSKPANK